MLCCLHTFWHAFCLHTYPVIATWLPGELTPILQYSAKGCLFCEVFPGYPVDTPEFSGTLYLPVFPSLVYVPISAFHTSSEIPMLCMLCETCTCFTYTLLTRLTFPRTGPRPQLVIVLIKGAVRLCPSAGFPSN